MGIRQPVDDLQSERCRRSHFFSPEQHTMKRGRGVRPAPVGDHHAADTRRYAQGDLRKLQPRVFHGDDSMAAHGQFQAAAQGHAVQGCNDRFAAVVEVNQQPGAYPGILDALFPVPQHRGEPADVGAGGKCRDAVAGNDEPGGVRVVLILFQQAEDFVGHFVVQRVQCLGTAQGDDFHSIKFIDQDEPVEVLVGAQGPLRVRHAGSLRAEFIQDTRTLLITQRAHQFQGALPEGKGKPATQFQVRGGADIAVQDVNGL